MSSLRASTGFLAALSVAGCGGGDTPPPRPNVLIVTLDTTRADRLGCYGNARIETPNLDRLAREGLRFTQAVTAVPSTLPSHASIFTGMYPARHGVHDNGVYALDAGIETLAERLSERGYRTGGFVSAFVLDDQFGLSQGFDIYDDEMEEQLLEADPTRVLVNPGIAEADRKWLAQMASPYQRRADAVTPRALEWLEQGLADEPFFLWVHYFDPHMDYTPPAPWDRRYDPDYAGELDGRAKNFHQVSTRNGWTNANLPAAEREHILALYDGELSYTDEWLGRLFAQLEANGQWDDTLVIVVADHGEGFGEHGQLWEHNAEIFDEVMHVPLLVKLPRGAHAGREVDALVRTIDVAPTVLDVLGAPASTEMQGESLLPLAAGEPGARGPERALLQALRERQAFPAELSWLGLRSADQKLVLMLRGEEVVTGALFDLATDPGERKNLAPQDPARVEAWQAWILEHYRESQRASAGAGYRGMDEITSDALDDLGYTR